MTQSTKPISPLRRRMIEDMTMRKLSPKTQTAYIRAVKKLTYFVRRSPDTASAEDLRRFQLRLVADGTSRITLNATITGLKFFFEVTLDRGDVMRKMSPVYEPRKLPVVLSPEEVTRLLDATPNLKAKAALAVAYGTGLRASEVVHLKVGDIDQGRGVIRVEQGKGRVLRGQYTYLLITGLRPGLFGARALPVRISSLRTNSGLPNGLPVRACRSISSSLLRLTLSER